MLNKTCKNHTFQSLHTEFILCNNPKASGKILLGFCQGNQGDANFRVGLGLQKHIITAALYYLGM